MPQQHTVFVGESLQTIAMKYYGDAIKWQKIFLANQNRLKNPDNCPIGERLTIPD